MGCFSNMDITRPRPFDGWIDYSYPTRRETLGWFMEDLVSALEERNISVAELVSRTENGLADYYDPRARYHYFSVLWADDRVSDDDLILAVGEVAHCLKEKYGAKHQQELQIRTGKTRKGMEKGISGGDRSLPAVA